MTDLPPKPVAVDGAKLRLYRMARLAVWIKQVNGVPLKKLQAFMTLHFGMKRRTSQEIVDDMLNARILMLNGIKFQLTKDGERWLQEIRKQGEF